MTKFTKEHRAKLSAAAKARYAKKPKKRGRKPNVNVGPYKTYYDISGNPTDWQPGDKIERSPIIPNYSPAPILTLCGQLEDSILLLENRISNAIAKINSLM